jgi:hypothetical protein
MATIPQPNKNAGLNMNKVNGNKFKGKKRRGIKEKFVEEFDDDAHEYAMVVKGIGSGYMTVTRLDSSGTTDSAKVRGIHANKLYFRPGNLVIVQSIGGNCYEIVGLVNDESRQAVQREFDAKGIKGSDSVIAFDEVQKNSGEQNSYVSKPESYLDDLPPSDDETYEITHDGSVNDKPSKKKNQSLNRSKQVQAKKEKGTIQHSGSDKTDRGGQAAKISIDDL